MDYYLDCYKVFFFLKKYRIHTINEDTKKQKINIELKLLKCTKY